MIRALRIANDDQAPLHIRLTTMRTAQQAEEDDEVMVSYSLGTGQIWIANIDGSPQEALTSLYIQAKINPAMEFAQEARQQKEKVAIPEYLQPFAEVFEKKAVERFPEPRLYDHAIDLKPDFVPRDCKVYPLSPEEERKLNEFVDENLKKGYIRTSKSPQASPFFFVGKKDGNLQPCQDYRYLNEKTVKNAYPLPLISDLVDKIKRWKKFTKMDLRSGYNNVRIKDGDQWKAAFKTKRGLFEPTVMFFGLCNSPATFQAMMNDIFKDMLTENWLQIYMDDILIGATNDNDLRDKTIRVVERLRNNDLYVKSEKCVFNVSEVEFLGMIVEHNRVSMDPVKLKGVLDWPVPTTVKQVRGFLGFGNFYRRFIDHYSDIVQLLVDLTKKDKVFKWTEDCQAVFEELKKRFTSASVLIMPDTTKPFVLECDASLMATAAVLRQQDINGDWHPVAYLSQSLLPAERNYEIYDQELLAIVRALESWRHYFHGGKEPLRILTDHKNLTYYWSPRRLNRRQAQWHLFLSQFDYKLHHCPGSQMVQSDAMTRNTPTHTADDNVDLILLPDDVFAKTTIHSLHIASSLLESNTESPQHSAVDGNLELAIERHMATDAYARTIRQCLDNSLLAFPA